MQIANLSDIRPLIRLVNSINTENPYDGWVKHKEKLRAEIAAKTESSKPKSLGGLLKRNSASKEPSNIFDYIEKIGREERALHEKQMSTEIENMKRMREEMQQKMLDDMKNQKFKLFDSLFGAPQPPATSGTPSN